MEFQISFAAEKIQAVWRDSKQNSARLEDHEQNWRGHKEKNLQINNVFWLEHRLAVTIKGK